MLPLAKRELFIIKAIKFTDDYENNIKIYKLNLQGGDDRTNDHHVYRFFQQKTRATLSLLLLSSKLNCCSEKSFLEYKLSQHIDKHGQFGAEGMHTTCMLMYIKSKYTLFAMPYLTY